MAEVEWLNSNGHQAWIACDRRSELFSALGNSPCALAMKMRGTWDHRATSRLAWLYTRLRCDIIHTHSPVDAWIALPLKLLGVPVIRTRHITNPVGTGFRRNFAYKMGCSHLIAAANCIREALVRDNAISADHISVVGEGIDTTRFNPAVDGRLFRERWGIRPGELLIGCVGMLRPEKGQKEFIKAAAKACAEIPEARFVVIGDHKGGLSPFRESYRGLARKLFGYDPWLPANPFQATVEKPFFMNGMETNIAEATAALDITVVPSLAEAQSRTAPESMCMGKAVIASRVGGLPEIIEDEVTGLLVPPGDVDALAGAIIRIVRDAALRQRLGKAALDKARGCFSLDVKMGETLRVYERVLRLKKERSLISLVTNRLAAGK